MPIESRFQRLGADVQKEREPNVEFDVEER